MLSVGIASENHLLELVVCGILLIVQEAADGQKEFRWKVSGLGSDIPGEEFLLHMKKNIPAGMILMASTTSECQSELRFLSSGF